MSRAPITSSTADSIPSGPPLRSATHDGGGHAVRLRRGCSYRRMWRPRAEGRQPKRRPQKLVLARCIFLVVRIWASCFRPRASSPARTSETELGLGSKPRPIKPGCRDSLPISIFTLPKLTPPLENVPYAWSGHATGSRELFREQSHHLLGIVRTVNNVVDLPD